MWRRVHQRWLLPRKLAIPPCRSLIQLGTSPSQIVPTAQKLKSSVFLSWIPGRHLHCMCRTCHSSSLAVKQCTPALTLAGNGQSSQTATSPMWRLFCNETGKEESDKGVGNESDSVERGQPSLNCSGCGALFQTQYPSEAGFIPRVKLADYTATVAKAPRDPGASGGEVVAGKAARKTNDKDCPLICQRCFSLKHYNTALNITLKADDYLHHLGHLKDKRALLLLMVDVIDFPGSVFPDLNSLIPPTNPVFIVANKIDLLPKQGLSEQFLKRLEVMITKETLRLSLEGCKVAQVHFVSAKSGDGVDRLTESILKYWGNRGDVYLLGCTNVGKSTLFNSLLTTLCGAKPGRLSSTGNVSAPAATISQWPGTTLGLLSFPIVSVGKRMRLLSQARKREGALLGKAGVGTWEEVPTEDVGIDHFLTEREAKEISRVAFSETEDLLVEIGLRSEPRQDLGVEEVKQPPRDRFRLYDTPGAINEAQLINLLTTKELNLALPKKSIKPRTFILKPGMSMLIGGLARLDYIEGPVFAYFTVFAASYLPVHTTKVIKADDIYHRNLGTHLLKIPFEATERTQPFPPLESLDLSITGTGWKLSAADIVLSSAGWVAVTAGEGKPMALRAFTPLGKGIFVREPPFYPTAVNDRGVRSQKGNITSFVWRRKAVAIQGKSKEKQDGARNPPPIPVSVD